MKGFAYVAWADSRTFSEETGISKSVFVKYEAGDFKDIRNALRKDVLTNNAETPAMEAQKQRETAMSYESSED